MCTRVLWNNIQRGVFCGRNMDWLEDLESNMWVLPRGMKRSGATPENPLEWESIFGSLVVTGHDVISVDGVNEAGLAVHMLYLPETSTTPRDVSIPGMSMSVWAQWYLDLFSTVQQAVDASREAPFQLQMTTDPSSGELATIHLAIEDPTGDTAIVECIEGNLNIYHDRNYTVMTNQPTFDLQLENLKRYRGFGGSKELPGTNEPADRFVRSAYYLTHLPEPDSERLAVAALMSVMRNVAAPFGVADPERPNVSTTIWRTITNLTDRVLYYDNVVSPSVFWVNAAQLDFNEGSDVLKLQVVGNFDLSHDVTDRFVPTEMFTFLPAHESERLVH